MILYFLSQLLHWHLLGNISICKESATLPPPDFHNLQFASIMLNQSPHGRRGDLSNQWNGHSRLPVSPSQESKHIALWWSGYLKVHSKTHLLAIPVKDNPCGFHSDINSPWCVYYCSVNVFCMANICQGPCNCIGVVQIWHCNWWIVEIGRCSICLLLASALVPCDQA